MADPFLWFLLCFPVAIFRLGCSYSGLPSTISLSSRPLIARLDSSLFGGSLLIQLMIGGEAGVIISMKNMSLVPSVTSGCPQLKCFVSTCCSVHFTMRNKKQAVYTELLFLREVQNKATLARY